MYYLIRLYGVGHIVRDHSAKEESRCRHMDYSFQLAARNHPTAPYVHHPTAQDSRGTLAGTRNSSMGPPRGIDPTTHRIMSRRTTTELHMVLRLCIDCIYVF